MRESNGRYASEPNWYRNFFYTEEDARGLEATEDLAVPGVFEFDLGENPAVLMLAADGYASGDIASIGAHCEEVRATRIAAPEIFSDAGSSRGGRLSR